MSNKTKQEALLSDLIELFEPLKIEDSPNQPIANANDRLNELLVRQVAEEIQQNIAALSGEVQVFENDAQLTELITSTGGHEKTLYLLLHNTFRYSRDLPVSRRAIGRARGDLKFTMNNSIAADKWHLLANVHFDPYPDYFELAEYSALPRWSILRYEDAGVAWYRVHPLLVETVAFKRAIEAVLE